MSRATMCTVHVERVSSTGHLRLCDRSDLREFNESHKSQHRRMSNAAYRIQTFIDNAAASTGTRLGVIRQANGFAHTLLPLYTIEEI